MKTTLEIPDAILRRAKMQAAREGATLRAVVTRSLEAELERDNVTSSQAPWRKHFGGLSQLHAERAAIDADITEAFEAIDTDAWR
jgi:hypothetical protein